MGTGTGTGMLDGALELEELVVGLDVGLAQFVAPELALLVRLAAELDLLAGEGLVDTRRVQQFRMASRAVREECRLWWERRPESDGELTPEELLAQRLFGSV